MKALILNGSLKSGNQYTKLEKIAEAIKSKGEYIDTEIILVPNFFYKWPMKNLVTFMNNIAWKKTAEKNGEKIDAQPFL